MLGPTLMTHGTPAQRERHLAKILTAEEIWCQGFSEPNAGSDLANLQTRAVLDGDHYVINGQKVWTSMAHVAEWGFFLVRTDPSAAKHKGITFILVDMKTPGITIRPLRQITGEAEFNEVFLENVRVPAANVVGKVNEGWGVALTTLAYERDVLTMIRHISLRTALERLVALARRTKRNGDTAADDPVLRQKIAGLTIAERCLQLNGYRSLTRILQGQSPGPEGSTSKLFWSQVDQELAEIATEVIGPYSQIKGRERVGPRRGPVGVLRAPRARQRHPRGHLGDPSQHPRRARARAAQGLTAPSAARRSAEQFVDAEREAGERDRLHARAPSAALDEAEAAGRGLAVHLDLVPHQVHQPDFAHTRTRVERQLDRLVVLKRAVGDLDQQQHVVRRRRLVLIEVVPWREHEQIRLRLRVSAQANRSLDPHDGAGAATHHEPAGQPVDGGGVAQSRSAPCRRSPPR